MNDPVELTIEECLDLLNAGVVGRVGMSTPGGPRIIPVNYAMYEDAIVFRTTPYSELGSYGWNTDLAFEIDQIDYERHQGWSVLAVGRSEIVDDRAELDDIRSSWDPQPWAGGKRHLYLRLRWRSLSGRRVGEDWTRETMTPVRRAL